MYQSYKEKAQFFIDYISEAHPEQPVHVLKDGKYEQKLLGSGENFAERCQQADMCSKSLNLSIPMVVDRQNNAATMAYGAWPERVVIVDRTGNVAYLSGEFNPTSVRLDEVDGWLDRY